MFLLKDISQNEIERMILDNRKIFWKNEGYKVIKDNLGQFLIVHYSGDAVGLNSEFCSKQLSNSFYEKE